MKKQPYLKFYDDPTKQMRMRIIGFLFAIMSLNLLFAARAQDKIEVWGRYEVTFETKTSNNPFNVEVEATFTNGDTSMTVQGFYDGDDVYRIRFMPIRTGRWSYVTKSKEKPLHNKRGSFYCTEATGQNRGMVHVANTYQFRYSNGTHYYPFGTTAYAWTHMSDDMENRTLASLKNAGFNKVRMCVFPKSYDLVKEIPPRYPFEIKRQSTNNKGNTNIEWDYSKFNPAFFQHLEKRIAQLDELGIEADLILFHPYDKGRWGFDALPRDVDTRYLKYIMARLSSYKNVWWSLANEWNYLKAKSVDDWMHIAQTVNANDPYNHLHSIHGATATYFDYWRPEFSHVSIQDETPVLSTGPAAMLRQIYGKPIICDEVGYEGNLKFRWGRYSPQTMTRLVLNGVMAGIYVTHGDTYLYTDARDTVFWAKGGKFRGTSWKNIAFIRQVVEACPNPLQMADISRDFETSTAGKGYYFVYPDDSSSERWSFNLPAKNATYEKLAPGTRFKVDIIDFESMTITPLPEVFETGPERDYRLYDKDLKSVRMPGKPLIALRVVEI
ncbi:DUF5060 domain-containing protein [Sphingobacterium suaedae]|uniref:DUF5060 domain-containing protein n=1 Tax=Sphingobacterium suaedae TaxID=1686402 RepID=A0ABW5KH11_9SPHI